MYGDQALQRLVGPEFRHLIYVLDVGCGTGEQSKVFYDNGKWVVEVDPRLGRESYWKKPIEDCDFEQNDFDIIWCCHVLEHLYNTRLVLRRFRFWLKPGGVLAITVPPMKPEIVGGHLTVWNAGLLLYNLVVAGFDCRRAAIKTYGYNISVLVTVTEGLLLPVLDNDAGDLEKLAHLFPPELNVKQGFNGDIAELNWFAMLDSTKDLNRVTLDSTKDLNRVTLDSTKDLNRVTLDSTKDFNHGSTD
jgi:SAM-dependent methyltransferase